MLVTGVIKEDGISLRLSPDEGFIAENVLCLIGFGDEQIFWILCTQCCDRSQLVQPRWLDAEQVTRYLQNLNVCSMLHLKELGSVC